MDNENEFFTEGPKEAPEEENVSASGISYGESAEKSSTNAMLIAIGAGAFIAGILMLIFIPGRKPEATNIANVPTISGPDAPTKFAAESGNPDDVYGSASVYAPSSFDEEAKKLLTKKTEVRPEPLPPAPPKPPKKPSAKKPAPAALPAAKKQGPEAQIVETSTPVAGEFVMEDKPVFGGWSVQISSGSSEAAAKAEWANLSKKHPQILSGLSHSITKALVNGNTFWRLRISNLASTEAANDVCGKLKAYGVQCFVVK